MLFSFEKIFFISNFLSKLYQNLLKHFAFLLANIDQVKNVSRLGIKSQDELQKYLAKNNLKSQTKNNQKSSSWQINYTYLFPAFALLLIETDTGLTYLMAKLTSNITIINTVFARRTFPAHMWSVSDVMVEVGIYLSAQMYLILLFDQGLDSKLNMYLFKNDRTKEVKIIQENGNSLSSSETEQIYEFRQKGLKASRFRLFMVIPVLVLFFGSNLILSWSENSLAQNSLKV